MGAVQWQVFVGFLILFELENRHKVWPPKDTSATAVWLDTLGNWAYDFVMQNGRPHHFVDGYYRMLTCGCLIFTMVLTATKVFCMPQTNSSLFTYCYPQGDLGATYNAQATTMKLWAPTARSVSVALFDSAASVPFSLTPMIADRDGVWSSTIHGNLAGKYYLYQIVLPGVRGGLPVSVMVNDPYARGCSANSGRTLIYDPATTDPQGWEPRSICQLKQ